MRINEQEGRGRIRRPGKGMCELRLEIFTVRGNMLNNLIMLVEKKRKL